MGDGRWEMAMKGNPEREARKEKERKEKKRKGKDSK
jgi:hypothetical protein